MIRGCRGGCSVEVKTFASVCMLPEFDARYLAFSVIIAKCFKALNAIYLKTLSAKKGPTHAYLSVYWKCNIL